MLIIKAGENSGNVKLFCENMKIGRSTWYEWKAKLEKAGHLKG
jgi:hypothetical protein